LAFTTCDDDDNEPTGCEALQNVCNGCRTNSAQACDAVVRSADEELCDDVIGDFERSCKDDGGSGNSSVAPVACQILLDSVCPKCTDLLQKARCIDTGNSGPKSSCEAGLMKTNPDFSSCQ